MSLLWKASAGAADKRLQNLDLDITRLQVAVLRLLEHEGAHTMTDVSRKFSVDASTLVPTVEALNQKGYISKERDSNDRRRYPLTLTDEGRALLAKIPTLDPEDPILNGLDHMGVEHGAQMIRLLHELVLTLPDSAELLTNAQSRLLAHGAKEQYLICKQQKV